MMNQTTPNQPQKRARARRPRGKAVRWSEVDIAALAVVGRADVAEARQVWVLNAPDGWEELLDARATIG